MAKKKKSKIKKILKNLLKVAALGTVGYGAAKMFGGRKGNVSATAAMEDANLPDRSFATAKRRMTQPMAYNTRETTPSYPDAILRGQRGVKPSRRKIWTGDQTMAPDRDIFVGAKKGGRVTGIAKRGFGRALGKK
jgi:hypothetical protein